MERLPEMQVWTPQHSWETIGWSCLVVPQGFRPKPKPLSHSQLAPNVGACMGLQWLAPRSIHHYCRCLHAKCPKPNASTQAQLCAALCRVLGVQQYLVPCSSRRPAKVLNSIACALPVGKRTFWALLAVTGTLPFARAAHAAACVDHSQMVTGRFETCVLLAVGAGGGDEVICGGATGGGSLSQLGRRKQRLNS